MPLQPYVDDSKYHHLYLSHSWAHCFMGLKLMDLIDQSGLQYRDVSLLPDDPAFLLDDAAQRAAITEAIGKADVVVVNMGVYKEYKKVIDLELDICEYVYKGKPVVAVEPWGVERSVPRVDMRCDLIVGWNPRGIVKAIEVLCR